MLDGLSATTDTASDAQSQTGTGYDIQAVRAQLPALREYTYLNVGTVGIMAEPVLRHVTAGIAGLERAGHAAYEDVLEAREQARRVVASELGAAPEEIAFTGNATDGVNLVAAGLVWQAGDEVIISDQEHPAMTVPWFYLQQTRGIVVRRFRTSPHAEQVCAEIRNLLGPKTRVIASSHVSHKTGIRLPVAAICSLAAHHAVLTLIDGAQAYAQFGLDVSSLGCDFYTTNGHKWLCGPKGTGIFFSRRAALDKLNLVFVGDGSMADSAAVGYFQPQPSARRFEYGTRGYATHAGLTEAVQWRHQLGVAAIERHARELSEYVKARVLECGWRLLSPREWDESSGLVTFSTGHPDPAALALHLLREHHIVVPAIVELSAVRVSTAYFNLGEDVDRLLDVLQTIDGDGAAAL
jgi:selenocysteine lyase/cysteine desulfurase